MYMLDSTAHRAFLEGVGNRTITDSEKELIEIILDQDIVTYATPKYSYTFDYNDLVEE